jgi:hypothetical protein
MKELWVKSKPLSCLLDSEERRINWLRVIAVASTEQSRKILIFRHWGIKVCVH